MSFPLYFQTDYITDFSTLRRTLELPASLEESGKLAADRLPLKIPRSLLNRVEKGNPNDPILLQFLPRNDELEKVEGFSDDPLQERNAALQPGVLKKYQGRALVLTTDCCAAQCRYCFRQAAPKNQALFSGFFNEKTDSFDDVESNSSENRSNQRLERFDRFFQTIRDDATISEIVLSGGDPLAISNEALTVLLYYIKTIGHVKRVRFHSRLPILVPERIDARFPLCRVRNFRCESKRSNAVVAEAVRDSKSDGSKPQAFSPDESKRAVSQNDETQNLDSRNAKRKNERLRSRLDESKIDELLNEPSLWNDAPVFYVVFHINHPNEIDDRVSAMFEQLSRAGIVLTSQTVLLKGINDDPNVLESLFLKLIDRRVVPYYLHQLDRVCGAARFEVPVSRGLQIVQELKRRLPGYAVPKYVQEVPGCPYKKNLESR